MEASRQFWRCIFDGATIRKALQAYVALERKDDHQPEVWRREVQIQADTWLFDDDDEFFAQYALGFAQAGFRVKAESGVDFFDVLAYRRGHAEPYTTVQVGRPKRGEIERVLAVFGDEAGRFYIPEPPEPAPPPPPPDPARVFLGHGRSPLWRDLKDHLQDQHGYDVEAYETGARAGHTIRDILESMIARSSFAVLVMTAEDLQGDGALRARQNVVHETGLFQGRLGFDRAIVAVEQDVELFSNLDGIQQLRFGSGNIREIYGDVLATLSREFPHRG